MKDTIISFETAKLVKEKGFGMSDEDYVQLPRFYEEDGTYIEYDVHVGKKYNPHRTHLGADTIEDFEAHLTMIDNSLDNIYLAPTQSLLQKWLRDRHNHFVYITPILNLKSKTEYKFTIYRLSDKFRLLPSGEKDTYEEALEEGLQEGLKLINK